MLQSVYMLKLWIEFFEDLEFVRGRSKNTISAYRRDLEVYQEFKKTKKSTPQLYNFLKEKGLSKRSQARLISSVRTYLKFLERNDVEAHELRDLKLPKVEKKPVEAISHENFEKLVQASIQSQKPSHTVRNHLTLYLMYGLGLRVTELINLNLESVKVDENSILIKGKGGKERVLPLNPKLQDFLVDYLDEHRSNLCFDQKERSLIINNKSKRPSRVDIWRWLESWSSKAGFENSVHPHQFRHACATALLRNGADLRSIQILLGHTSLQTTQMYTAVAKEHLNKTLDDKHPFSKVDFMSEINSKNK